MRPCNPECAVYKRSGGGGEEAREVAEVEVNEREGCHMWNNEISEPFPSDVHKQETGFFAAASDVSKRLDLVI